MTVPAPTRVSSMPSVALLIRSSAGFRLLRHDAGLRDDMTPLYNFRRDKARQFFRAGRRRLGAELRELAAHDRIGDGGSTLLVQFRDDWLRCAPLREQREPAGRRITADAGLGDGRNIRERRHPLLACDRECT